MLIRTIFAGAMLGLSTGYAQSSAQVELANLREDVRGLVHRVGELSLKVEQLERQNGELRERANAATPAYATLAQMSDAVLELKRLINAGDAVTADRAATQIKKLGDATNTALESLARGLNSRPAVQTSFSENYSKEGTSYTIKRGDTIGSIAKQTGTSMQDIINANKIADPTKIQAGQTLFIPTPSGK